MTETSVRPMMPRLSFKLDHPDLIVGVAVVSGLDAGPSVGLLAEWLDERIAKADDPPEATRQAVRQLLKHGGFKATGRNKPASEYLAEARKRGEFPRVLDCVDVMNVISLESGFPISILDLEKVRALYPEVAERGLCVRLGAPGESYAFNTSGHSIELANLIGVAVDSGPMIANPVKDSMPTKVGPHTREVMAVIYASLKATDPKRLLAIGHRFADQLGGGEVGVFPQA